MTWESKYVNFGVVKTEGDKVLVYKDQYNCIKISIGKPVNYAMWAGGELSVYLTDGKVRRYRDQYNYMVI
jgi:hypothetical protein